MNKDEHRSMFILVHPWLPLWAGNARFDPKLDIPLNWEVRPPRLGFGNAFFFCRLSRFTEKAFRNWV